MNKAERLFLNALPIDESNPTPRYIQLASHLRDAIRDSTLKPGDALPPERAIVSATNLSRVTIRKALDVLVREGLLRQRHGSGTYVSDRPERIEQSLGVLTGFSADMTSLGHVPSVKWLQRAYAMPTPTEAMMLGLSPGEQVLKLHRLRLADGQPLAVELAVVPANLLPNLETLGNSLYEALSDVGALPEKALQRMRASRLPAFEAELLGAEEGETVLYIERLSRLASGRPVEFTRSYYRGDKYDFVVELTLPKKL